MARALSGAGTQYLANNSAGPVVSAAYPYTFGLWYRFTAGYPGSGVFYSLMCFHSDPANGNDAHVQISVVGAGSNQVYVNATMDTTLASKSVSEPTTPAGDALWHHVMLRCASNTDMAIFRDGGNYAQNTTSVNPPTVQRLTYGRWPAGASGNPSRVAINMEFAEAAAWNVALTDEEIAAIGKGVSPLLVRLTALTLHHPMWGQESPEPDRWKNGYDLTLTSSPAAAAHPPIVLPWQSYALEAAGGGGPPAATGNMFSVF